MTAERIERAKSHDNDGLWSNAVLIADGVQGVEFQAVGAPRVFKNAVMK